MPSFEETLIGRPSTLRTYKGLFRKWILGRDDAPEVLCSIWRNAGLSPRTIKTLLVLYGQYLTWQGKDGKDIVKRLARANSKMVPQQVPKALTKEDLNRLTETWDELYPEHCGLILAGGHAGLRLGEVLGLKWDDVNFLKSQIEIVRNYDRLQKSYGPTKSGHPRVVTMSKALEQALMRRYQFRAKNDRVFSCPDVGTKLKRVCREAGIKQVTFHALRHTFATLALEAGSSIKSVSDALGHAQVSTTVNTYWNLCTKRLNLDFLE